MELPIVSMTVMALGGMAWLWVSMTVTVMTLVVGFHDCRDVG